MYKDGELIIENLKKQDSDTLDFIYKMFYPSVRNLVMRNSGSEADAEDIFQESIIVVYRKLKYENLSLSCSLSTYLYSIAKRLWLKELERKKLSKSRLEGWEAFEGDDTGDNTVGRKDLRYQIYQEHFLQLSEQCQKLLRLFYQKLPIKDIAELMGLSSEKYAKKRKYQCKENLINRIKSDPRFKDL